MGEEERRPNRGGTRMTSDIYYYGFYNESFPSAISRPPREHGYAQSQSIHNSGFAMRRVQKFIFDEINQALQVSHFTHNIKLHFAYCVFIFFFFRFFFFIF